MCVENQKKKLFENNSVEVMKLVDYLDWTLSKNDSIEQEILLPAIQRGLVWKPSQIVDLWDSLLRGMPIGGFMLNELGNGQYGRAVNENNKAVSEIKTEALGLLDGQQRTLAMLLGWPKAEESKHYCIWIDLSEEGKNGFPFELRITTKNRPFGFQRHNHQKFSKNDYREARECFEKTTLNKYKDEKDYELWDVCRQNNLSLPLPWKGKSANYQFLLPLRAIWNTYMDANGDFDEWIKKLELSQSPAEIKGKLHGLDEAFKLINSADIPLIKVPNFKQTVKPDDNVDDPLTKLFERIGRNGTPLSPDELLYSMIKQSWPEAHNLVLEIEKRVGHLMKPTDFVMTAFRLAMAEQNETDKPQPNHRDFHRHLGKLLGANGRLRDFINQKSPLVEAFETLNALLAYHATDNPAGIPLVMMPHLSLPLLQVLLRWILKQVRLNKTDDELKKSRDRIRAFVLFWFLCEKDAKNAYKASKEAFEILLKNDSDCFPGTELYQKLTFSEANTMLQLVSPDNLEKSINIEPSSVLRGIREKLNNPEYELLFSRFWYKKSALLWLQRAYLEKTFKDTYHPLAGREDEDAVPYDYDHLCPQAHWGVDWRNIQREKLERQTADKFRDLRWIVGNSIGNYHILDSSTNRSLQDTDIMGKVEELKKQGWTESYSVFPNELLCLSCWEIASLKSTNPCEWGNDRLLAFQSAVDCRVLYLYRKYYEGCKETFKE